MTGPEGICPMNPWNATVMRHAPPGVRDEGGGDYFAAQLGASRSGRLRFANGAHRIAIRADSGVRGLYRARFGYGMPMVSVRGGVVTVRFPRLLGCDWFRYRAEGFAEFELNAAVRWDVQVRGGASRLTADLRGLRLGSFALEGGANRLEVVLPAPSGTVALTILGGASNVAILRPEGVAARLCVSGGATNLKLDRRRIGAAGGELDLRDGGYDGATDRYEVIITGGANNLIVDEQRIPKERTLIWKASEMVASEGNVNTTMVEARGVEKEYATGVARTRALRGVDLSIPHGEMVAVVGPSGCGKTTLLNCLSGLDEFDRGEVFVGGESISGMSDKKRTRIRAEKMGFIFQTYNLIPVLTAVENVELPLLVAGTRPKEARGKALSALETVGIPEQSHKRPNEMSGGQQQRVTVARSLVNDPAIVWADEPTGALDSETSKEIVDLLVKLNREKGQTFVLVTHDASVAARAHRTILMGDGRIEGDEPNEREG